VKISQQPDAYYPPHGTLLDAEAPPEQPEIGRTLQPSTIFPMDGRLKDEMIFVIAARWAMAREGVVIQLSLPDNKEGLEKSDIQASLIAQAEFKGFAASAVLEQLPTGNRFGPWTQTVAALLAHELSKDDEITIYRAEDNLPEVDLSVYVMTPTGGKYRPDGSAPRDPHAAKERLAKQERRMVMYVDYPSSLINMGGKAAVLDLKNAFRDHLMNGGAEEVGFCDAKDDKDNKKCGSYPSCFTSPMSP